MLTIGIIYETRLRECNNSEALRRRIDKERGGPQTLVIFHGLNADADENETLRPAQECSEKRAQEERQRWQRRSEWDKMSLKMVHFSLGKQKDA